MKKLLIVGASVLAKLAKFYFENDSEYQPEAFVVDAEYLTFDRYEGLPVFSIEEAARRFSPQDYSVFVAIGYTNMNKVRAEKYEAFKQLGYPFATYVSSRCSWLSQYEPGDNCFILEDNTVQPFVKIGDNVILWSGNHIGHDAVVNDHCFISSHVIISGFVEVGKNSFLGVNSTIVNDVSIAAYTFVGAGVIISKNTEQGGIYLPDHKAKKSKLLSHQLKF